MKKPIRIAITGAAGQFGYSLIFRIANGDMLGCNQPVILQLLDIPQAQKALHGIAMELEDSIFPMLHQVVITDDLGVAFRDAEIALLIGAQPRSKDMNRNDLIEINAGIFAEQGRALNQLAAPNVKVLVIGNPANTNALIVINNTPDINSKNISSMMRLDHNRAIAQVAQKLSKPVGDIKNMVIWGNHSGTQYPDLSHARIQEKKILGILPDDGWIESQFIPTVQKRGTVIIEARGLSSAASAASAAINHMHDWVFGSPCDDWVTMGVLSDGSYDVPQGVVYGFPVTCSNGEYKIVQNLPISQLARQRILQSYYELLSEREQVKHLLMPDHNVV